MTQKPKASSNNVSERALVFEATHKNRAGERRPSTAEKTFRVFSRNGAFKKLLHAPSLRPTEGREVERGEL